MRTSSRSDTVGQQARAALLWDESFLWGVMAYKALIAGGLSCDLIRADDVRSGGLRGHTLLFVPGGWASNKMKALGADGAEAIKRFVHDGGAYLGLCGGAGLATMDGIGLLPVKRRPTKDRVPSFSGRIGLMTSPHPLWQGISGSVFSAWWPSQFVIDSGCVTVHAAYGDAMSDSYSSDVNVGDAEATDGWKELERLYQINLDPKRLLNEPAVIEGTFGKGKVLLSLVHFDTPNDRNGATVLRNIWQHLGGGHGVTDKAAPALRDEDHPAAANDPLLADIEAAADGLIELGVRNFLWFWRNPLLLQWRRGVRGLEYCTLSVMVRELAELLRRRDTDQGPPDVYDHLERIRALLLPFADKAKRLLVLERFAMQSEHITYERCDNREIQSLREELFSLSKSHGGLFKDLLDPIDRLLYSVMTRR